MVFKTVWLLLIALAPSSSLSGLIQGGAKDCYRVDYDWGQGYTGTLILRTDKSIDHWEAEVTFDTVFTSMEVYNGDNFKCSGMTCTFSDKGWNGQMSPGSPLELAFQINYPSGLAPKVVSLKVNGYESCEGGHDSSTTKSPINTTPKTTILPPSDNCNTVETNYREVLRQSLLFYEAQRSGKLPENQRVTWRKDSALNDGSDVGMDLTGGYYDAGDFVKFGFPMAYTITALAWGGITFKDGYTNTSQTEYLLDALKWGTDYFIKAHPEPNVFYGQVGDGNLDHAYMGRPEDMNMPRPSMKIDQSAPGSDLAGETAAAMAATSMVFQEHDSNYASILLKHAKELFDFADKYRQTYDQSITNAQDFYKSWSGYQDELIWSALWMHKATNEDEYLEKAKSMYTEFDFSGKYGVPSWDDKSASIQVLMYEATGESQYKASLETFCDKAVSGTTMSPQGQLWENIGWGSLRYSANVAFVCLQAAQIVPTKEQAYTNLAISQMDYIMWKTGKSFIVGYGDNYPVRPHHRSSLCQDKPAQCDWSIFQGNAPNAHVLYGALVGGPIAPDDQYTDSRSNFAMAEVACDYNAGLQGLASGLHMKKCM